MMRLHTILAVLALFTVAARLPAATPSFADFDQRARDGERLNIVFFGSSLTWGTNASDPQWTSWRAVIGQRLTTAYPKAHFTFWDASLGGTGSQLGVFRLERDVLRRRPDLVFVDFSANDDLTTATPETLASYEALVRRLVLEAKCPVVQVILPFQWNVAAPNPDGLKRRDAHLAIARAYHTAVGDAVGLVHQRLKSSKVRLADLWPFDRVHPGDAGYALFAEAVWDGVQEAIKERRTCAVPPRLLHAATYLKTTRCPLAGLARLPVGWRKDLPNRTAASFDMLMSRWLDEELVALSRRPGVDDQGKKTLVPQTVERLKVQFRGATVLLLGESTEKSGKYKLYLNGKLLERDGPKGKEKVSEFDAGWLAYLVRGNGHLVQIVAEGLDPATTHTLEIEPVFSAKMIDQELRLESICVAGGEARVVGVGKKE
jgi:lysophospholipase L1-like esterase